MVTIAALDHLLEALDRHFLNEKRVRVRAEDLNAIIREQPEVDDNAYFRMPRHVEDIHRVDVRPDRA